MDEARVGTRKCVLCQQVIVTSEDGRRMKPSVRKLHLAEMKPIGPGPPEQVQCVDRRKHHQDDRSENGLTGISRGRLSVSRPDCDGRRYRDEDNAPR